VGMATPVDYLCRETTTEEKGGRNIAILGFGSLRRPEGETSKKAVLLGRHFGALDQKRAENEPSDSDERPPEGALPPPAGKAIPYYERSCPKHRAS